MKPELKEESDSEMDLEVESPKILMFGLRDQVVQLRDLILSKFEIQEIEAGRTMEGKQIKNGFYWFEDFKSYVTLAGGN